MLFFIPLSFETIEKIHKNDDIKKKTDDHLVNSQMLYTHTHLKNLSNAEYWEQDCRSVDSNMQETQTRVRSVQIEAGSQAYPSSSPYDCMYCTLHFTGAPVFIPTNFDGKEYTVSGNFCSPNCVKSHVENQQRVDMVLMCSYFRNIHNIDYCAIKKAPHPWFLDRYGGPMSAREYRANLSNIEFNLYFDDATHYYKFKPWYYEIVEFTGKTIQFENFDYKMKKSTSGSSFILKPVMELLDTKQSKSYSPSQEQFQEGV